MNSTQKTVLIGIGVVLLLAGGVWFLQGINILPGSYTSGDPRWAINGVIAMVIGAGLFWLGKRK